MKQVCRAHTGLHLSELFKLCLLFQGLLVAILYCFVNKEVRYVCLHERHHLNLISSITAVPSSLLRDKINETFLIISVPIASLYRPSHLQTLHHCRC